MRDENKCINLTPQYIINCGISIGLAGRQIGLGYIYNILEQKLMLITEISHYPFAYQLIIGRSVFDQKLKDITYLSNTKNISKIDLPLVRVNGYYPNQYEKIGIIAV